MRSFCAQYIFSASQVRNATGIKIMEEKGKAMEKMYWAQEDEKLLKKMLENNPELDPAYQGIAGILSGAEGAANSVEDKVKLVFIKHGIPPTNKALVADIAALVSSS